MDIKELNVVLDKLVPTLDMLEQRWKDEHEYESWQEYVAFVRKKLGEVSPEAKFVSLTARPFQLTFMLDGKTCKVKVGKEIVTQIFQN